MQASYSGRDGVSLEDEKEYVRGQEFGKKLIEDIVSPDAPITTNEKGGSQSDIPVRFDLIDGKALFEMAKVLDTGAKKYGEDNWRLIDIRSHLNHLLMHTYAYLAGDETDDHLSHILCRATFALGVALQDGVKFQDNGEQTIAKKPIKLYLCSAPHFKGKECIDPNCCWNGR